MIKRNLQKLVLLALISLSIGTKAQWVDISSPTYKSLELKAICFPGENNGFATGFGSILMKTIDGGTTWAVKYPNTFSSSFNYDLYFIDSKNGFACGAGGTFSKTTDAGETWTKITTGITDDIFQIHYITKDTIYLATNGGVLKTIDGGANWIKSSTSGNYIESIHFPTSKVGYAGGYKKVIKTTDQGATWAEITMPIASDIRSIYFFDESTGFCTGANYVFKTTDGGKTWKSAYQNTNLVPLNSVVFKDKKVGYAVGGSPGGLGVIVKTIDGGDSWITDTTNPQLKAKYCNVLSDVNFNKNGSGFIAGYGTIFKLVNPSASIKNITNNNNYSIYPNPAKDRLFFNKESNVEVYDITGNVLLKEINTKTVDVSALAKGMYFVRIAEGNKIKTERFIKE